MEITIEASVFPTEDPERVRRAILNIFPDAVDADGKHFPDAVDADGKHFPDAVGAVRMTATGLGTLTRRISEQKIRNTARSILLRSVRGNGLRFCLNKQAALVGKVNFTECRGVLGDIAVSIAAEKPTAEIVRMTGGPLP